MDPQEPTSDPRLLDGAVKSATAGPLTDYMVALDRATGKVLAVWKGTTRRLSYDVGTVEQYAVGQVQNAAAAKRHGIIMHRQFGRPVGRL